MEKGARFPLERINNKRRKIDNEEAIARGNHKSAKQNLPILKGMVSKEVEVGFQLPIPIDCIHNIPHAVVAPYGLQTQQTVDEKGHSIPTW